MATEALCAVFDSGTFGQLIDISKNGLSVLLLGTTKLNQEIAIDIFQLCGTPLIDNLQCEIVRKVEVKVKNKSIPKGSQVVCLNFNKDEQHIAPIENIIQNFSTTHEDRFSHVT